MNISLKKSFETLLLFHSQTHPFTGFSTICQLLLGRPSGLPSSRVDSYTGKGERDHIYLEDGSEES